MFSLSRQACENGLAKILWCQIPRKLQDEEGKIHNLVSILHIGDQINQIISLTFIETKLVWNFYFYKKKRCVKNINNMINIIIIIYLGNSYNSYVGNI